MPLNLERLQHWIDRGLIDPSRPITMRELYETRCVHGVKDGVKLLGDVRPDFAFLSQLHRARD
jgi:large subunit ribosomal protein L15